MRRSMPSTIIPEARIPEQLATALRAATPDETVQAYKDHGIDYEELGRRIEVIRQTYSVKGGMTRKGDTPPTNNPRFYDRCLHFQALVAIVEYQHVLSGQERTRPDPLATARAINARLRKYHRRKR